MAAVNVTSVNILNNPGLFTQPLQFEIQYECNSNLEHDLEWKATYVGAATTQEHDQILESVLVGPVGPGQYKFVFQTNAPDASKLPKDDIVGVTVVLLECLYQGKEFIRIGYYVNNDYPDEESRENPPDEPQIDRLVRSILADKPRVTRFPIEWDPVEPVPVVGGDLIPGVGTESQAGFNEPTDGGLGGSFGQQLVLEGNGNRFEFNLAAAQAGDLGGAMEE